MELVPANLPFLSIMLGLLPLCTLLLWLLPEHKAREVALMAGLVELAISILLLVRFDPGVDGFQFIDQAIWIPTLNLGYLVGVDGLSILFLPATVLIYLGVILASWNTVRQMPRGYYGLLMLLQMATLGIFSALDSLLFFIFWELSLGPVYFLLTLWGIGPRRHYAATQYSLFMLVAGIPLIFAFLLLGLHQAEVSQIGMAFDLPSLLAVHIEDRTLELLIFGLFLLGFGIKVPIFPFHSWLPVLAMEGPLGVIAIISGLKIGLYGLLRFLVPLTPLATADLHWLLAGLGTIGVLYGALLAIKHSNLRGILAFFGMSQAGFALLGLSSLSQQGLQGTLLQLINFCLISSGLLLLTSFLRQRTGSTELVQLGGAAQSMPMLSGFFIFFGLAALGMPGTSGFPAELLILLSVFKSHTGAGLAALVGLVLLMAAMLNAWRKVFLGRPANSLIERAPDLCRREKLTLSALALLILLFGFFPNLLLHYSNQASQHWADRLLNVSLPESDQNSLDNLL